MNGPSSAQSSATKLRTVGNTLLIASADNFPKVSIASRAAPGSWTTNEAIAAKDQECGKVGDNCRKRVAELSDREAIRLQSNKSIGDHAVDLDAKISTLEDQIRALGPAPGAVGSLA